MTLTTAFLDRRTAKVPVEKKVLLARGAARNSFHPTPTVRLGGASQKWASRFQLLYRHFRRNISINSKNLLPGRGFSLVELLIVIAIIAILAAILFPVFGRARENARRSTCQSNLKQIGLGFIQYSQDYDEYDPIPYNYTACNANSGDVCSWDKAIEPYMGMEVRYGLSPVPMIFECPNDTLPHTVEGVTVVAKRSYAMASSRTANDLSSNKGVVKAIGSNAFPPPLKITEIPDASGTIMVAEYHYAGRRPSTGGNVFGAMNGAFVDCPMRPCSPGDRYAQDAQTAGVAAHFDGYNYLFADGHVKWLLPARTMGPGGISSNPKGMWTLTPND